MDTTTSTQARRGHISSELEKFQLFYEMVPVSKDSGRIKRSRNSAK
ncbi:MAG TPA: hypothetical protein PLN95_04185 [Candidatus Saccharibacteria bacterium]|nr:hypothetical protein [Candidatus Saccharibacteria bacterium]